MKFQRYTRRKVGQQDSLKIKVLKGSTRISTPAKPPKNSHMTLEERNDLENMVSKNQVNDMNDSVLKMVDFSHSQEMLKRDKENLMDQKMEGLQKSMETMH